MNIIRTVMSYTCKEMQLRATFNSWQLQVHVFHVEFICERRHNRENNCVAHFIHDNFNCMSCTSKREKKNSMCNAIACRAHLMTIASACLPHVIHYDCVALWIHDSCNCMSCTSDSLRRIHSHSHVIYDDSHLIHYDSSIVIPHVIHYDSFIVIPHLIHHDPI